MASERMSRQEWERLKVEDFERLEADLQASKAEVARLRDDCAGLLKILDATYDGPLGRFTRDRIGAEIDAALAATRREGADDE
jgi:hypothetical protein